MTPQSGVELLDLAAGNAAVAPVAITDVNGDILWTYNPGAVGLAANPIKLLPNGNFLIDFSELPLSMEGDQCSRKWI